MKKLWAVLFVAVLLAVPMAEGAVFEIEVTDPDAFEPLSGFKHQEMFRP